jgi:subtilisin family serine protease
MKIFRITRSALLAVISATLIPSAFGAGKFVPGEILVKPRDAVSTNDFQTAVSQQGASEKETLPHVGVHVLRVPEDKVDKVLEALSHNPKIEFAERNFIAEAVLTPNDPYYAGYQWHLPKIQAPAAWDITTGSTKPIIAVVDTGVFASHPDLSGKILPGYDYVNNDSDPADDYGHGTEVSGTAAAFGNNGVGVAGVAFANQILAVKVLDSTGSGTYSAIVNGITYAADHGARIINLSLGGPSSSSSLQSAIDYAWSKNIVTVAAAGNSGNNTLQYPAACNHVVAVSATDSNDALASFSSYGTDVALSAPGVNIATTSMDGGYVSVSGTSFSSPIVSGVVALMATVNPQLSNAQLVALLEQNTDDLGAVGYDTFYGNGRVNAYKAVTAARASLTAADTVAPTTTVTAPTAGSTVSGTVTMTATATDNVGVTKVEAYVDGQLVGSSATAPANLSWNTSTYANGAHSLQSFAYDAAGNVGKSTVVNVTVQNTTAVQDTTAPTVTITSPATGSVVSSNQKISVTASDNVQVTEVDLYIDGRFFGTSTSANPVFSWNTRKAAHGQHTLQAIAYDPSGNVGQSSVVTVIR